MIHPLKRIVSNIPIISHVPVIGKRTPPKQQKLLHLILHVFKL